MKKKMVLLTVLALVLAMIVSAVAAQPPGGGGRGGEGRRGEGRGFGDGRGAFLGERDGLLLDVATVLQEQTGLTLAEIREQLQAGSTPAEVITAAGGDVEATISAVLALITERTNQAVTEGSITQARADQLLANAEMAVSTLVNEGRQGFELNGRGERGLEVGQLILEEAGLEPQAVREALAQGQTLAGLIEAAGGDVAGVTAAVIEAATTRINEAVAAGNLTQARADAMLATLENRVNDLLNGSGDFAGMGMGRGAGRLFNEVAAATGLTAAEVREQVQAGSSLTAILTENEVAVDTFITDTLAPAKERLDAAVTAGRMSQAVAEARYNLLRVELSDALSRTLTVPAAAGSGS